MADVKAMLFDIIAKDNASRTFHKVGVESETAGKKSHKFGLVAGAAVAAVGVAAVEMGKKSVEAYQDAAKESMMLARVTGLTVKQASRLRFAAEESGVEFGSLQKSMQRFSKSQSNAVGQFAEYEEKVKEATAAGKDYKGHLGSVATAYARLGVATSDASGKALPMQKVLEQTAEQFKKMPDGPDKTALAMQLFGKSGADMIKILNKGKDGIRELGKEADKTGNTIGNTESVKKQIQAQREFHAAISGLMITIGSMLQPIITALAEYMTKHVAPAFMNATKWVKEHKDLIKALVPIVVALVAGLAGFKILTSITNGFKALNLVMAENPIGLVIVAIAALAAGLVYAYKHSETFRNIVNGAFTAIKVGAGLMWDALKGYFKFIINAWLNVAGAIVNGAARAFGWVPGLGGKLKAAAAWFNDFKKSVNDQLDGVHKNIKITADTSQARKNISGFVTFTNTQLSKLPKGVHAGATGDAGDVLNQGLTPPKHKKVPHLASGGIVHARPGGTLILAGEAGQDEMVTPLGRGRTGAGGDIYVTVNGALDPNAVSMQIRDMLAKFKRDSGGRSLGLA